MTDSPTPVVSVAMPVRNALPWLPEAIESILGQTLASLELVAVDDGSDDGSLAVLREYAARDARMRVVELGASRGVASAANVAVAHCRAPLIARMDADDVSEPRRLEVQVAFMRTRAEVVLAAPLWIGIDADGRIVRHPHRIARSSPYPPFAHGSIVFRRAAFDAIGGYREACMRWEDLDFYWRIAAEGGTLLLPEPLYRYRFHIDNSVRSITPKTIASFASMLAAAERVARGADYVLDEAMTSTSAGLLHALHARTSHSIMAGIRPRTLGGLMRCNYGDPLTWKTIAESLAGEIHPPLARWVMNVFAAGRDGHQPSQPMLWSYRRDNGSGLHGAPRSLDS